MTHARTDETPVLIVGAGPAGLTTAITLARQGVASLLVERRRTLSGMPRATAVSTRTMELLRSWGLESEVRAGEMPVEWLGWGSLTLATAAAGRPFPLGMPSRAQAAVVSPTTPACVPQDHLEPVLLDHLRTYGKAEVIFGTEVTGVNSRDDGVSATLRDVATGRRRTVRPRYLVAADGAHSTVRTGLGIGMHGPDHLYEALSTLFRAPLWDLLGEARYGLYSVGHPEAAGVFVPAGGDRWIYGIEWRPDGERLADFTAERVTRLIRLGAGVPDLAPRIERVGAFSFAAQVAERFRHRSAFLIGDAAHRVTPRGGTGMNTAIHDGYDLGWKLGWVLSGWAGPELLDTYETERRPVAEHNTARSADENGSTRTADQELSADIGGRIPHGWLPAAPGVSTLDLLGPGWTLFTGPDGGAWAAAAAGASPAAAPVTVRSLDPMTARTVGVQAAGALLVRPDGAPASAWPAGTAAVPALHAALARTVAGRDRERQLVA
jgi:putative polyketide hydroxylase